MHVCHTIGIDIFQSYLNWAKLCFVEIEDYARVIGIEDVSRESELLWIAKEGINAPLPENWKPW